MGSSFQVDERLHGDPNARNAEQPFEPRACVRLPGDALDALGKPLDVAEYPALVAPPAREPASLGVAALEQLEGRLKFGRGASNGLQGWLGMLGRHEPESPHASRVLTLTVSLPREADPVDPVVPSSSHGPATRRMSSGVGRRTRWTTSPRAVAA